MLLDIRKREISYKYFLKMLKIMELIRNLKNYSMDQLMISKKRRKKKKTILIRMLMMSQQVDL